MKYINNILFLILVIIFLMFYLLNNLLKEKSITYENFENNTIPKIIIQTWKTKIIPNKYKNDINSIKKFNSDFQFLFFSDEDIDFFINKNYPQYYDTYNKLPIKIQKIDFFRYIAIYHYGGFYLDLDMTGFYPLKDILKYDCVFPIEQKISKTKCNMKRFKNFCDKNVNIILGQYAFGAKPNNKFIKTLIDEIDKNIDLYIDKYNKDGQTLEYVYASTGPDFVTNVYINYKDKNNIHTLDYNLSHYFGKYAKHNHYGTWK
jgi:mannosyltransferase OCH1-like enzyme